MNKRNDKLHLRFSHIIHTPAVWYLLMLAIVLILVFPQLHHPTYILGTDTLFHDNRFYDTAMQIKTGCWNYWIEGFGFRHSARVINAIYGPDFAYLMGGLLLLVKNWVNFETATDIILALTVSWSFMFYAHRLHINRAVSVIASVALIFSYPISEWFYGQEFTSWGMASVIPLIYEAMHQMQSHRVYPYALAISLALPFQVHMMSGLLGFISIIPSLLYVWLSSHSQQSRTDRFVLFVKSAGVFFVLTANVWIPLLYLEVTNRLIPAFPNRTLNTTQIRPIPHAWFLNILRQPGTLTIIVLLLAVLLIIVTSQHQHVTSFIALSTGTVLFILTTSLVPWLRILDRYQFLQSDLQFPIRFLPIALIWLAFGFGTLIRDYQPSYLLLKPFLVTVLAVCAVFIGTWQLIQNDSYYQYKVRNSYSIADSSLGTKSYQYLRHPNRRQSYRLRRSWSEGSLGRPLGIIAKGTPDYLPGKFNGSHVHTYWHNHPYQSYIQDVIDAQWRKGQHHMPNFDTATIPHGIVKTFYLKHRTRYVRVPVIKYHQTKLTLNGRPISHYTHAYSTVHSLYVTCPRGTNQVKAEFLIPNVIKLAVVLVNLIWAGIAIYTVNQYCHRKFAFKYPDNRFSNV